MNYNKTFINLKREATTGAHWAPTAARNTSKAAPDADMVTSTIKNTTKNTTKTTLGDGGVLTYAPLHPQLPCKQPRHKRSSPLCWPA